MASSAAPTHPAAPAIRTIIYLGMDVHKDSITIAVLPAGAKVPTRLNRLPNDLQQLRKWLERWRAMATSPRVMRRAAPGTSSIGDDGMGLRLCGDRTLADPQAFRRPPEARQTRRRRPRTSLSRGRARRGPVLHPNDCGSTAATSNRASEASTPSSGCLLQSLVRHHGRGPLSQVLRCQPRLLRDADHHSGSDLVPVVECKDIVRPAAAREGPVGATAA